MKYINNNPDLGIAYDWAKIRRELKKLAVPKEYYNPATAPLDSCQWYVLLSERATGKTTNLLLMGLVMYKLYGTVTIYCRNRSTMVAPKHTASLYNVIIDNHYIEKLTDGEYNSITYYRRRWYLSHIDEDGNMDKRDPNACCHVIAVNESADLKSSCNEPRGDLFIFDEFIMPSSLLQPAYEFVTLCDVISTVFRLRESGKVFLLANTIDKYNQYFHDLEIADAIEEMQVSQNKSYVTDGGTKIYIEIIGSPKQYRTKKTRWNQLFMGFKKPELASITGNATWAVRNYQHIPDDGEHVDVLYNKIYISHNAKLIRIDIVRHPILGQCLYLHWATRTYPDSIILTLENLYDARYLYKTGDGSTICKLLERARRTGRIYYAANDVGRFYENYIERCAQF
jgi:hypothetical protein